MNQSLPSALAVALSLSLLPLVATAQSHDHDHDHDHDHSHSHEPVKELKTNAVALDFGLTLEGIYKNRTSGDEDASPAGFGGHGHEEEHDHDHSDEEEHGHDHALEDGFNTGHSELSISAQTQNLQGMALISLNEDDVSLEEIYAETRRLPSGLTLRAGKFLSDIGYINSRHPHAWHFVERPLVNEYLFGDHGLLDTGVRLSWKPSNAVELGTELLQGEDTNLSQFDEGGVEDRESGPRLGTVFAKFSPETTGPNDVMLGVSAGYNSQFVRHEVHDEHDHSFEGDNWFAGVDVRYKRDGNQPGVRGDFEIGGEYFYTRRDVREYVHHHAEAHGRDRYDEAKDGAYFEAIYGVGRAVELGARVEALGMTNDVIKTHPTRLGSEETSYRYSGQLTWHVLENTAIRAQLTQEDFAEADNGMIAMLQLTIGFGGHAGHDH